MLYTRKGLMAALLALALAPVTAFSHGDVTPQPVNTDALPDVGEEWLSENPYRAAAAGDAVWAKAIQIGDSGFNQNCARCHGLGAVSGGLAPDLRYLEAEEYGDEWFVERFRHGMTQNGTTKMPAFGEILGQKAAWAIRTYIETRPDDGALEPYSDELHKIRDQLAAGEADVPTVIATLEDISGKVDTASGAPVADSAASRAAHELEKDPSKQKEAADMLSIGISAAE